ncbi:MAG: hypothetical protein RJA57_88 [Bacteroidota bacterium]|jgi:UDP-N-acetylmuramoyl-L-alanyl-D-glutamate--2,6-diaminopimelate ligase
MLLQEVLYKTAIRQVQGSTSLEVTSIHTDSREVLPGGVFIAVRGGLTDGHHFIAQALSKGAIAVVCEVLPDDLSQHITWVQVENSIRAAGHMAHRFYGSPSARMRVVGVTGTNGKTTIATLLYKLFTRLGHPCGLLSTVENRIGEQVLPATHTTPDAVQLNRLLARMAEEGCTHVFMETSSHALDQHRVAGIEYAGAIFSNITHDHLDYHKTFDAYIRAKKSFFDGLSSNAFALTNVDDKRGGIMLQNTAARRFTYALRQPADFKGRVLDNGLGGLQMNVNDIEVHFRLMGEFNAYNLLAVFGAATCLGEDKQEVLTVLSELSGAEGRFEPVISATHRVMAIIDYAHTPDALLNVLAAVKKLRKRNEQVLTVVGCGGDRDRTKRPLMAEAACEHSDRVIFTSDNPRNEDPAQIIRDMEEGLAPSYRRKYLCITDRREAIKTAISLSQAEDIILVAGKGHEKYQEVRGVRLPFDDRQVVQDCFRELDK